MAAQHAFGQLDTLQGQGGKFLLHHRIALQQADQFGTGAVHIGERIQQVEHAATFSQQWFASRMMGANSRKHPGVFRQCLVMQFGIAAGQVQAVGVGQLVIMDRREKLQLSAHCPQQIQAGAVGKSEGFITGYGNTHTGQQRLSLNQLRRGERHRRRQRHFAAAAQRLGCGVQARIEVIEFTGLHQAQVTAR